ncbi:MAG: hypothetical protein RMM98_18370, partial [Acidobacteriota bacterium]|nr:hypothetical protein [Acidobacteriota bacterium]
VGKQDSLQRGLRPVFLSSCESLAALVGKQDSLQRGLRLVDSQRKLRVPATKSENRTRFKEDCDIEPF